MSETMPIREFLSLRLAELKVERERVAGAIAEIERLQASLTTAPQESTPAAKKAK